MTRAEALALLLDVLAMPPVRRIEALRGLPPGATRSILDEWWWQAHGGQRSPRGDWRIWPIVAGRGFGKTRAGAEWVWQRARDHPGARIALVGASLRRGRQGDGRGRKRPARRRPLRRGAALDLEPRRLRLPVGRRGLRLRRRPARPAARAAAPFRLVRRARQMAARGRRLGQSDARPEARRAAAHDRHHDAAAGAGPEAHPGPAALRADQGPHRREPPPAPPTSARRWRRCTAAPGSAARSSTACCSTISKARCGPGRCSTRGGCGSGDGGFAAERAANLDEWAESGRPALQRIVVGLDPPASATGDACGIVVCGLDEDGVAYVLADLTASGLRPEGWARRVAAAAEAWQARQGRRREEPGRRHDRERAARRRLRPPGEPGPAPRGQGRAGRAGGAALRDRPGQARRPLPRARGPALRRSPMRAIRDQARPTAPTRWSGR